jgi:hypothetical protein
MCSNKFLNFFDLPKKIRPIYWILWPHPKKIIFEFICGRWIESQWQTKFVCDDLKNSIIRLAILFVLLFCSFICLYSVTNFKKIWFRWKKNWISLLRKKLNQWTNVNDYHPIWMIANVRDLGARWYFSKIHLPQMIFSSRADRADDISYMSADHHPQSLVIIFIGWVSSTEVDYHPL